ncbi:MAG: STAS domain-containing protein, partial [Firmicutes bacterium]|nr:STAS domain-containing protein [Bacillota bacterium]
EDAKSWMVALTGEIDIFNSPDLKQRMLEMIEEKKGDIYLDCKNLTYMDSTALGALVGILKNVKLYGGEIHLLHLRPSLSKLFHITNLDKVFVLEGDYDE